MRYGLSEEQLAEILQFLSRYPEVEEAILFGSRAIGTFKEASDVDIALKGENVTFSTAASLKFDIEEDTYLPFFFDFVAYPTITNEELRREIDNRGVVIYREGGEGLGEWRECKLSDEADNLVSTGVPVTSIKSGSLPPAPLSQQRAIADILSSLDNKINLLHRENKTLEAMAETLFRQWFVEEADEGWEEGKIGDEFDFTMGQSPVGASFNENGIGTPMFQGNADFGFRFPTERVFTTEPTRFAEPLDTLISVRAPIGQQNMTLVKCCIGRGIAAFRYRKNKDYYTYTYFKFRSLMTEIKLFNNEGILINSIGKSDFETLSIVIPPQLLVQHFEITAKPLNEKVIENCKQIELIEKLREALPAKLMRRKVKVDV